MADEPNVVALLQRARRACEDIATLSDAIAKTLAETRRLLAAARPESALAPKPIRPNVGANATDNSVEHADMVETVQMMIAILAKFPVEVQFKIIKVLAVRTMVVGTLPVPTRAITPTA
jgi:hypothetical protein